jgi:hypothetical protein
MLETVVCLSNLEQLRIGGDKMRSVFAGIILLLLAASFGSAIQIESTSKGSNDYLYARYKCKYAYVDGEYIRLPDFELQFENSRAGAALPDSCKYEMQTEEQTTYVRGSDGPRTGWVDKNMVMHDDPAAVRDIPTTTSISKRVPLSDSVIKEKYERWSTELPDLKVGMFGFWPDNERLSVTHVLGPDDVLVSCNGTSFRLLGMDTSLMEEGQPVTQLKTCHYIERTTAEVTEVNADQSTRTTRGASSTSVRGQVRNYRENKTKGVASDIAAVTGLHVSIAFVDLRPIPSFGSTPVLLAMPTSVIRTGLTKEQFHDLLDQGVDPRQDDIARAKSRTDTRAMRLPSSSLAR